jgi:tetratricopeptide (TPR) repeat protein
MRAIPVITLSFLLLFASEVNAQSASRLIAEGDSLLALDRPQKAVDKYSAAVEMEPTATSYSARARAWLYMDRMDRFLLDAEKALQLDSLHVEANTHRALYAFRGEEYAVAERLCTRALAHGAQKAQRQECLVMRGRSRTELKKYKAAVDDLQEGLGDSTTDIDALKSLARAHDALGAHDASLIVLEKLCSVEPADIGNWANRGFELSAMGRHADALAVYDQALKLDKDEPTVLSNRANALLQLGRETEAMSDVQRSLRSYPANAFALRTRAMLLLHLGEKEKACSDLNLARILGGVQDIDQLIEQHCSGTAPQR